jgi:predicted DNA-binding transcriptional regulator YafY
MARNEQLIRQHKLLQFLEGYRFGGTLEELRDDLVKTLGLGSLHTRSVRRDLEALQAAGIDIDMHETQRGTVWKFGPRAKSAVKITASATELIALSLSRDLLYPLAGTPFWQGIESLWDKLQGELPPGVRKHYQEYRQTLYVRGMPAKSYQKQHGMLSTLHRAILERRVCDIEYEPPGKDIQTRQIEPYAVVFYHSSLYILAAAHEIPENQDRIRHLKLDRFHKVTALDEWFHVPKDFDLETHLGKGSGIFSGTKPRDFKMRISPRAARWVTEDPWHPDQTVETQPDGSLLLTVRAAHELEIIPRVLALGPEAELLAPESCRKQLAAALKQAADQYAAGE